MIVALSLLAVALAAGSTNSTPVAAEIGNVRFATSRLAVVKGQSGGGYFVRGPIRVDMSFRRQQVRKPILKIACLCEVDGRLVVYSGLWDKLKTNDRLQQSEISESFKMAGYAPSSQDRLEAFANPELISGKIFQLVDRSRYTSASYGSSAMSGGLFRLGNCALLPKLLLCRFELWQNGALAGSFESSRSGLGKYDLPTDWHLWRRYPQKFKYEDR